MNIDTKLIFPFFKTKLFKTGAHKDLQEDIYFLQSKKKKKKKKKVKDIIPYLIYEVLLKLISHFLYKKTQFYVKARVVTAAPDATKAPPGVKPH